jgi:hypothetical protein
MGVDGVVGLFSFWIKNDSFCKIRAHVEDDSH